MKLKKLLKEVEIKDVKGSKDIEITGICSNSKLVAPGNLFVAKRGKTSDGTQFIPEAIAAGAIAILSDIYDPFLENITQLIDPQVADIEAKLADHFYQHASRNLFTVGITGTSGKTTTSYLVKHILDSINGPCGLMGTIECIVGTHRYQTKHTTPDVSTNHKMLREMLLQQCQSAVMEVSSHALDQKRVAYIDYKVAIFTNLTPEHLDYHKNMEEYARSKNVLFRNLRSDAFAIINNDDPWTPRILEGCNAKIITYGTHAKTDLTAYNIQLHPAGTQFELAYQDEHHFCEIPYIGRHNVYNALAAIAVGLVKGQTLETLISLIRTAPPVQGRLEFVSNPLGLNIYVDYAHKDDALKNVLHSLRELSPKRLITIFGCGGDRDTAKRPRMARVAEEYSDLTIVTSDNPRSEDPMKIIAEITSGFQQKNHIIEPDRQKAIAKAIQMARKDDIILIAGKGHETYQIFAHKTIDFDDRKIALELCGIK